MSASLPAAKPPFSNKVSNRFPMCFFPISNVLTIYQPFIYHILTIYHISYIYMYIYIIYHPCTSHTLIIVHCFNRLHPFSDLRSWNGAVESAVVGGDPGIFWEVPHHPTWFLGFFVDKSLKTSDSCLFFDKSQLIQLSWSMDDHDLRWKPLDAFEDNPPLTNMSPLRTAPRAPWQQCNASVNRWQAPWSTLMFYLSIHTYIYRYS